METLDELLAHHGVKGMKWGVRKTREETNKSPRFTPHQKEVAKKVAIGAGVLALAAGAAYVTYTMHKSGHMPISDVKRIGDTLAAKSAVSHILSEPTDVIHATRGRDVGFSFLKKGGVHDPLHLYESAFGADSHNMSFFKKLPDGKIAASFLDPEGRKDFAGRSIPHQVIIPRHMADGINNSDDVINKIWPLLRDTYRQHYSLPKYSSYS